MATSPDLKLRLQAVQAARRVVIKVGTRLLTGVDGFSKDERVAQLVGEIAILRQRGVEVVLVSSGAIGSGMRVLGVERRPAQLPRLQALAAVGQMRLMALYESAARNHGFHCGQVLLCADDVRDRERHLNTAFCLDALLAENVLPIINENDSVSVDEIKFGDNDRLAALVALLARADLTLLLTSVDGLREHDGKVMGDRISLVSGFDARIRAMARDTEDRNSSTGGMTSKLKAAESLAQAGEPTWIADGRDFSVLRRIFDGEDVGTLVWPTGNGRMSSRKRYLAFFSDPTGSVVVDEGAARALTACPGASLLARGVVDCSGSFERGDTVVVVDRVGRELARGVTNYAAGQLRRVKGLHSREINRLIEGGGYDCVIHRNYLVVTDSQESISVTQARSGYDDKATEENRLQGRTGEHGAGCPAGRPQAGDPAKRPQGTLPEGHGRCDYGSG